VSRGEVNWGLGRCSALAGCTAETDGWCGDDFPFTGRCIRAPHALCESDDVGHEHAFIGAGAVVTGDVTAHAFVVGNPGLLIGWASICGKRLPPDFRCTRVFVRQGAGLRQQGG
jgi:hypothetical protein